jgi:hypothetical protein
VALGLVMPSWRLRRGVARLDGILGRATVLILEA